MAELDVRHIGGKDYTLGATIYNRVSQRGLIAVRLYEARDRKLGREVAIKEIVVANDDHQGRTLLKRGLEEAQLLVRMGDRDRRHLPIVYDADDTRPQTLAIVMERGLGYLPHGALAASKIGIAIGVVFELLLAARKKNEAGEEVQRFWFVPIPGALGFALILPPSLNIALALGAVIAAVWRKASPGEKIGRASCRERV